MSPARRPPRVRFTVARGLAAVAVAAVAMKAGVTAFHVGHDPESRWVYHVWERRDVPEGDPRRVYVRPSVADVWPQFWRKLLDRPWPGTYVCGEAASGRAEFGAYGESGTFPHTLVGSRAVPREDVGGIEASLKSLKTLGTGLPAAGRPAGGESRHGK